MQYQDNHIRTRSLMAQYIGAVLTPELAANIEIAAFGNHDDPIDVAQFEPLIADPYYVSLEYFADALPELTPLHEAHWKETEKHRHGLALRPNLDHVIERERRGQLVQIVARVEGGAIAGHLRLYLNRSLHTSTVYAEEDTLYVTPAHRGSILAMRLLRYAERVLIDLGVKEIRANSKLVNKADVLMRRMKYRPVAIQFVKFIGESNVL